MISNRAAVILSIVFLLLFILACWAIPTGMAIAQCQTIGIAQAANASVNVRGTPGNTTQTPIANHPRGTQIPIVSTRTASGGLWYQRCEGGFVAGSVVIFGTSTPGPTPSRTPTRTATAKPIATITPVATDDFIFLLLPNGTPYQCRRGNTGLPSVTLIDGTWAGCVRAGFDNTPTRIPTSTGLP